MVGLGKVGSAMLAVFASKGYEVVGFDSDPTVRECVRNRSTLTYEPKVKELFEINSSRITVEDSLEKAIIETDVTFIIVPTPSKASGGFDTQIIEEILSQIAAAITDDKFHTIVISSTIMPGDMARISNAILDTSNVNQKVIQLELIYSPEFIALGSVVDNLLYPQFVLIGQNTMKCNGESKGSKTIKDIKKRVTNDESPIHVVTYESAEIAKISCNTFLTTKVSYANLILVLTRTRFLKF